MADAILGEDDLARNTHIPGFPNGDLPERWQDLPGLVDDPLIDEDAQVAILQRVDETGSATLGDLMALLPGHPNPAKAVLRLARLGVLTVEPGLTDVNSLLHRRIDPPVRNAPPGVEEGGAPPPPPSGGKLHRLHFPRPQPEIFYANWSDRAMFRREPLLQRPGIYLALFSSSAYAGTSACLADRLVASNHLLQHGIPDLIIAAVDRNGVLTGEQAQVAERLLARAVEQQGVLKLANKSLPAGRHVELSDYAQAERFVRDVVTAVRKAGLAFTPAELKTAAPEESERASTADLGDEAQHFTLHACGVHATAVVQTGKWVVQTGSQIRDAVLASAGNGVLQHRQELLRDGGLVPNGKHLLLTRDVTFNTASSAARFVVGIGHRGSIWRPLPQSPAASGVVH